MKKMQRIYGGFIQETKEEGEEIYYKEHGYEAVSIFRNAFVAGYVAGLAYNF